MKYVYQSESSLHLVYGSVPFGVGSQQKIQQDASHGSQDREMMYRLQV